MEVPDVRVVTKADLGEAAKRARADLDQALAALGASDVPVVVVSSVAPVSGIDQLVAALDAHRERVDLPARRLRARRLSALREFTAEHGESALRSVGGRREAQRLLESEPEGESVAELVRVLERAAA
jgi:LAO/AO transport system kinase